jgi:hypothetical protein
VPPGNVGGVAPIAGQTIVSETVALPVQFFESVTLTVKEEVPAAIGVPVIAPFAASDNPLGNDDPMASANVYGAVPPVPVSDWL